MSAPRRVHEAYMTLALEEARLAAGRGEVPVGAVLVKDDRVIARGGNTREAGGDVLGHAEVEVLRRGAEMLGDWRLTGCTLYVTLEPCPMCAGACLGARVDRVVYGAPDPAAGCLGSLINLFALDFPQQRPRIVAGVLEEECRQLLSEFFAGRRLQDGGTHDPD